jgi:RimJ/RimL family protein N-acetyltransferase
MVKPFEMNIPTITTSRLVLRPFSEIDIEPLHQIMNEADIMRYFPNPNPPDKGGVQTLIAWFLTHWEEHGYGWWAVAPLPEQPLAGWCGLTFLPETGETEVAYLLSKTWWGNGLATEAARAALQFGFSKLGFEQTIAVAHPENRASIHDMEKLGMDFTGHFTYFGMEVVRYLIGKSIILEAVEKNI